MMDDGPAIPGGAVLKPSKEAQEAEVCRAMLDYETARRVAKEREREQAAAQEALRTGKRTAGALGKCVATIPAVEFFDLCQKYGYEEVHSKGFLKYFNKEYPHLSPNRA